MNRSSRRDFIRQSALASGMLLVPKLLHGLDRQVNGQALLAPLGQSDGKRLVVVQLTGGNDGLNTIVPHGNDLYYQARPTLAIPANEVIRLTDELGLHPALAPLRPLYDKGEMTVINNVGYPFPDRSHFRSLDIWHTASRPDEFLASGWVGRLLDTGKAGFDRPHSALEIDDSLSLVMRGEQRNALAVPSVERLLDAAHDPYLLQVGKVQPQGAHPHEHHEVEYLYKTLIETQASADYLYQSAKVSRSTRTYPATEFGKSLKVAAELIRSGVEARVYYVSCLGFDTHVRQQPQQARLLQQVAEGLAAFSEDLKQAGRFDDTVVMVFSEFGRRVKQNASNGTDHGTANNVWLLGGALKKAGFYNAAPDLANLDNGDLKFEIDFRRIYATLLDRWLQADAAAILGESFPLLGKLV